MSEESDPGIPEVPVGNFGSAVSKADLLWWMLRTGEGADQLARVAGLLCLKAKVRSRKHREQGKVFQPFDISNGGALDYAGALKHPVSGAARFFCVASHSRLNVPADGERDYRGPECIRSIEPLDLDELKHSGELGGVTAPLFPWSRLWPRLKKILGAERRAGPDLQKLVVRIASGGVVRHMPVTTRRHWAPEAQVLVDYSHQLIPFFGDFNVLCKRLELMRGEEGLRMNWFTGHPGGACRSVVEKELWAPERSWRMPGHGTRIVILSDLGLLSSSDHPARSRWLRFGRDLQRRGFRPVVLAPIGPDLLDQHVQHIFDVICLGRRSALQYGSRAQARLSLVDDLLALLSPAINVGFALLRDAVRLIAPADQQVDVEARFWNHDDVERFASGCVIRPDKLADHRGRFSGLPLARQVALIRLLIQHHSGLNPLIRHEEVLSWAEVASEPARQELAGQIEESRLFMQRTAAWLYKEMPTLNVAWRSYACRGVLRAHPEMRRRNDYLNVLYAAAWRDVLQAGDAPPVPPDNLNMGEILRALTPIGARSQHCQLVQKAEGLWLERADPAIAAARRVGLYAGNVLKTFELGSNFVEVETQMINGRRTQSIVPVGDLPQRIGSLAGNVVRVRILTGDDEILIDAIPRPAWARAIGRDGEGLWCDVEWLGQRVRLRWEPIKGGPEWGWQENGGVGVDDVGLYADFTLKGVTQRCRWIAPGTFQMGSPPDEVDRGNTETLHGVTLTRGYWLADSACTQALWQAVMGDNPSYFKDDPGNPVEQVSWNDVQTFLDRLNALVPGLDAALPSEAQWEYACRAGTSTPFSFGENITPEQVNYNGHFPYANEKNGLNRRRTVPVKSLPPSPWGLYEMHGNVFEWCADWFGNYSAEPQVDPSGRPEGVIRVLRGGSWNRDGRFCRAAHRSVHEPGDRSFNIGFRLAPGQRPGPAGQEVALRADGQAQAERAGQAAGSAAGGRGAKPRSRKGSKKP